MSKTDTLYSRAQAGILALLFGLLAFLPMFGLGSRAGAAELTERSIDITTSEVGAEADYTVSFEAASSYTLRGVVIDFCQDSPLIETTCTSTNGVDTTGVTLGTANTGDVAVTGWTTAPFDGNGSTDNHSVVVSDATGVAVVAGNSVIFTLEGIDNPTAAAGTFYARIVTYSNATSATNYSSTNLGSDDEDAGGIALSTANQLTVNARVQEQLEFCIGVLSDMTVAAAVPANCTAVSGTTVDVGVVDTAGAISPVATSSGGNESYGIALVRTNASNGATIRYFAEQATTGTEQLGSLRVAGAACNNDGQNTFTDQCFRSRTTAGALTAANENFGMTVSEIADGGITTNLVRNSDYDGDGTLASEWKWREDGSFDTLASSTAGTDPEDRVLDYEMLRLRHAAVAAPTTPSGQYSVSSTFVATSIF